MRDRRHKAVGMALVAVILLIASVFVMMTAGVGDSVTLGLNLASRTQFNRRTNYAAYGAMQMALDKLTTNLTYSLDPAETGDVPGDPELVYELAIYNNYANTVAITAPDGKRVDVGMVYIKAKSDFRAYPGKYTSTMFSKAYVGANSTDFAIVGTESVNITNSVVDAWYVREYSVTPPLIPLKVYRLTPSGRGRVTTNSINSGGLSITGNSMVNCSLRWGPGGDEAVVITPPLVPPPGPGALWNPDNDTVTITKAANTYPARVARYHPPRDPKNVGSGLAHTGSDMIYNSQTVTLEAGDYRSLRATNSNVTLVLPTTLSSPRTMSPYADNRYYFSKDVTLTNSNITLQNASGAIPCDIYIGESLNVTNSFVNWENAPSPNVPDSVATPPPPPPAPPAAPPVLIANQPRLPTPPSEPYGDPYIKNQMLLGPRTMRVFFVGSGAPKFKDCNFFATDSKMSLHACGKAMTVHLNNSILWGGLKGFSIALKDSYLHYQRVFY